MVERRPVVFCDFDGTIAIDEVIVEVWREFAPPGWERDVEDMLAGRKSLLQGDAEIFARIPTSRAPEIAAFSKRTVRFRPGFEDLLRYCGEAAIEFNVVTGALDFFVEPILAPYGERIARVVSIPADLTGEVIRFHADLACETCALCKAKVIDEYRDVFRIVIGDSITDEHGALIADAVFARDRLAAIMRERGLPHHEFDSLRDVRDTLRDCYRFPARETFAQPPSMVGKRVERGGLPSPPLGETERGPGAERGAPTSVTQRSPRADGPS